MKKIIALLFLVTAVSCNQSNTGKTTFSEEALKETLLTTADSQVAFKDILKL
jgi:hypothetical protein